MSNNAHELSNRLLNALDNNYNVVDMHTVNEIISILEKFNITKELLETTRLGKHVNELRRKTSDPTLARRAKVLVKRWRDLVIPTVASPAHTGSNRSSAERTVRRLGGTPLTSPALSLTRQVVSPRPPSRPAWGGYESDSQDVILVDDDPPPPPTHTHKPHTPTPPKRPPSPEPLHDDKKAKRDKKPKKRRGHSRAGSGTEANTAGVTANSVPPALSTTPGTQGAPATLLTPPAPAPAAAAEWRDRNGTERRRNGCRRGALDPYTALVNKIPPAGAKVKTTAELLEYIQSKRPQPASASASAPPSPDVMVIEPDACPVKVDSPLRNGTSPPSPARPPSPLPPLEDERPYRECTCGEETDDSCPAAKITRVLPLHVHALHNAYLPGVNGTRAPMLPHKFAVRKTIDPNDPALFTSIVPLYKYSDYADDSCAKNMSRVPLCQHLPWTEFAPDPPPLPDPPSPPPIRPYPIDEVKEEPEVKIEKTEPIEEEIDIKNTIIEAEMVSVPCLEPSERLKAPILSPEEDNNFTKSETAPKMEVEESFEIAHQDHRTVERTKEEMNGQMLYDLCMETRESVPYDYSQICSAPVITLPVEETEAANSLQQALDSSQECERDEMGRPIPPPNFTEWHECARLGELIALPYVVID